MGNTEKIVFVVDDSDTFLVQVENALESRYDVRTMSSGANMFNILGKIKPDIILLDIEMPKMSGFEVLEKLKSQKEHADIPVIFLTGVQDEQMEIRGFGMGAADYIDKPFSAPIVINRVELHLHLAEISGKSAKKKVALTYTPELKTVFAVDDSDVLLSQMERALGSRYDLHTAGSGANMFTMLGKVRPDIILLDIDMPGMGGFDVLEKLKAQKEYADIPVIFLTGVNDSQMENRGFSMGIADYIDKPLSAPIVINRIELHLKLKEINDKRRGLQSR